jgi:hypothetical protein
MEEGMRKWFFDAYILYGNEYPRIFNIDTSEKRQETDGVAAGTGLFEVRAENGTTTYDSMQEAYTKVYTHPTWALGLRISEEAREDDQYGLISRGVKELGKSAAYTQELDAMTLFNSLSATLYTAESTNYTLLSTTHFMAGGGTYQNRPTIAADLSLLSLEAGLILWSTDMKDQRGRKINTLPKYLLHGPSDMFMAVNILKSEKRPFTADNTVNAVTNIFDIEPLRSNFITDDGRWFLLAAKEQTSMVWFNRRKLRFRNETLVDNGADVVVGSFRASSGATTPLGIFGSP